MSWVQGLGVRDELGLGLRLGNVHCVSPSQVAFLLKWGWGGVTKVGGIILRAPILRTNISIPEVLKLQQRKRLQVQHARTLSLCKACMHALETPIVSPRSTPLSLSACSEV